MFREMVYLTKFIPHTKFWALDKIRHLFKEPILALGCHIGDTFWYMKMSGDITGSDVFEQYFQTCIKRKTHKRLIKMDLNNLTEDFGKYGCVTAFFLLEHMSKEDGLELLRKMDILGENIVILVPYGVSDQETPDSNVYQRHVSAWYPEDFTQRGFQISVCVQLSIKKIGQFPYKLILAVKEGRCFDEFINNKEVTV